MTHVLIVDDDPSVSEILREIVETYGWQATDVQSAKDAATVLAKGQVSLILLDLSMPGITGDQFLEFIHKKGFKTPVVVISAHIDEGRETVLRNVGISDVVLKPFEVADVIDAMEKALKI